jgi:hypothetical protein
MQKKILIVVVKKMFIFRLPLHLFIERGIRGGIDGRVDGIVDKFITINQVVQPSSLVSHLTLMEVAHASPLTLTITLSNFNSWYPQIKIKIITN